MKHRSTIMIAAGLLLAPLAVTPVQAQDGPPPPPPMQRAAGPDRDAPPPPPPPHHAGRGGHIARCAQAYRSYNSRTDRYVVRRGVTRRCTL